MKPPDRSVLLPPVLLTGAVLIACLFLALVDLPGPLRVLLPAAVALGVGQALFGRAVSAERRRAAAAEARLVELAREASQMRHDLRGILSPAMLTADRLTMSQDPVARRAGEAMIATVERAEERLRRA